MSKNLINIHIIFITALLILATIFLVDMSTKETTNTLEFKLVE